MKTATSQRSFHRVLLLITLAALIMTIPFAIYETMKMERVYLFSDEFWTDVIARFHGSGRFRFILQPLMGLLLGVVHGKRLASESFLRPQSILERWRHILKMVSGPLMVLVETSSVTIRASIFRVSIDMRQVVSTPSPTAASGG